MPRRLLELGIKPIFVFDGASLRKNFSTGNPKFPCFFLCRFFGVGSVCASEKAVEDGGNHAERLLKALYFFKFIGI